MNSPALPKVLVVDDLAQNVIALEALIGRADLELLTASSGTEALEIVLQNDVALALIDVQMPGMDGFELAELMRGNARSRQIPIIFLTAAIGDPSRQFRGYEAGAVDFLSKPFDGYVLRSKIEVFVQLYDQKRRLRQQLAELKESLRLNELFTAVLGHDLRSPLAAVLANAEIVKRVAPAGQIANAANRIVSSGERMSRMISQILELARVRAQSFKLAHSQGDLYSLCLAVNEELDLDSVGSRLAIERRGDTVARIDPDLITQMMTNLVSNALQHGDTTQPVSVRIDGSAPDKVVIEICNRGKVAPDTLPAMSQSLCGVAVPGASENGGLGLGLHIVGHIAGLHGGSVTADSATPDEVTFRVVLPRLPVTRPRN